MRIGLVGCVKTKRSLTLPAQDLYRSPLFEGRRRYVTASCDRWYILSAKHGLLHPKEAIAPYDVTLTTMSTEQRRSWAQRVLAQLDAEMDGFDGVEVELHAGAAYRDYGLRDGLVARGAVVTCPAEHLGQGLQRRFYRQH